MSKNKVSTNRKTRYSWNRCKVDVLKLGHYYFNKNSSFILPVKLPDSDNKDKIAKAALDVLGIKSLAVVFKHLEDDNRLRAVIAGHADASDDEGGINDRYKLSELRAKAVYCLLAGDNDEWAKTVYQKHRIEDYQLLLKYIHLNKGMYFGASKDKVKYLDPGEVKNSWNDNTDKATRDFIVSYNAYAKVRKVDSLKLSELMKKIKDDDKKRWPAEMWKAVYVLYENAICRTLTLKKKSELEDKRENILKFCDDMAPIVACGESVPLKTLNDQKKSNYEPEPGRGVEVIFFKQNQLPGKELLKKMRIVCADDATKVHEAKECPIFYKHHMKTTYIDHRNLSLVIYHMKFIYYDRILKDITPVPEGLSIEVSHWNKTTKTKEMIDALTDFNDGVYTVKVPESENRKNIAFWFKAVDVKDATKRYWIYTENTGSKPKLVSKTDDEIKALTAAERFKYYDLPKEWCSLNQWTRFDKYTIGDKYQQMMKKKKFKPYGSKQLTSSKPLMFSLDDIVVTDGAGLQNIVDKNHNNDPKVLSKHSRVTLLYADANDDFKIKIHKPITKEPFFSDVTGGFKKNLIHDCWYDQSDNLHSPCRAVVFCSNFFDVYNRRTEMHPNFKFNKGHILGARAARLHDSTCSGKKSFSGWNAGDKTSAYVCDGAGNYRLHYLHDWGVHNNKLHSGLILYWNCRFKVKSGQGGKKIDKKHYIEEGMKNAMERHGLKKYQLEKLTGSEDIIIKTFPLFEAKQDYKVGALRYRRGGKQICMVDLVDDTHTSSMGDDTATFRHSSYKDEPNRFAVNDPNNTKADYDGQTFNPITGAHEIGHAMGLDDEYIRTADSRVGLAQYDQYYPGVPYSVDHLSLMNKNRGTRMHQHWLYVNWVNDAAKVGGDLNTMLKATKFQLALRGGGFDDLLFDLTDNDYRNIYKPVWEADVDYGGGAHGQLIVYKLGDGEFANNLKSGEKFTGIMVVRPNIQVRYTDDTQNWTGAQMVDWIQALDSDLKLMLDKKYWLECDTADHEFAKVYMYFLPHYSTDNPAPPGTHYKLNVKKNGNHTFNPHAVDKSKIEVDNNVDNKKIIRHFFGQFAGTTNLTKAEIVKIKEWIEHNTRGNDTYSFEDL